MRKVIFRKKEKFLRQRKIFCQRMNERIIFRSFKKRRKNESAKKQTVKKRETQKEKTKNNKQSKNGETKIIVQFSLI